MPEQFVVRGRVIGPDGEPLRGATVVAFDQDLPSKRPDNEQRLGDAVTDAEGAFAITYGREDFGRLERGHADLRLRVLQGRAELRVRHLVANGVDGDGARILFNAPAETTVELVTDASGRHGPSEYERLRAELEPVLDGVALERATDEDVDFLAGETEIPRERIALARAAARLATEWHVPAEGLYALARMELPLVREELVAAGEARLREALERAIDAPTPPIVSAAFRARIDETVRAILRLGERTAELHVLLRDAGSGRPLADTVVQVEDVTGDGEPHPLGSVLTDADGSFTMAHPALADAPPRRIRLLVRRRGVDEPLTAVLEPDAGGRRIEIALLDPRQSVAAAAEDVPAELTAFLQARGVTTLAAIRQAGGLRAMEGLPVPSDHAAVRQLEAHAQLGRLSDDAAVRAAAIAKGFGSVAEIATRSRPAFVSAVGDAIGDLAAARLHLAASVQTRVLDAVVTGAMVDAATPLAAGGAEPPAATAPASCGCKDCTSAVGPLAYFADLLRYATEHLYDGAAPVTIATLEAAFHQPFGRLPASCEAAERRVRQVRLVSESLRDRLRAVPPGAAEMDALARAEASYRLAAYQSLLSRLGTSYEEIRRVRATVDERAALADRLDITLTTPAPAQGDELARLFLDASPTAPASTALTETTLEGLFGLAATTRDPLSGGATLGDDEGQITRWTVDGIVPGRNTSPEGSVFVTLESDGGGGVHVEVHADPARARRLAAGTAPSATASLALAPEGGSGLRVTMELAFTADTAADAPIELVLVPRFLTWRLARLRQRWAAEDATRTTPVIDPDMIAAATLVDPLAGPVAALWQARSDELAAREQHVRAIRTADPARPPGATLDAMLSDTLGTPGDTLDAIAARQADGEDVASDLRALRLSGAALDYLVRMRALAGGAQPVTEAEWDAVIGILVQSWKEGRYVAWRAEEMTMAIGIFPEDFRVPEEAVPAPPGSAWRTDPLALLAWMDVLRARVSQRESAAAALAEAVSATEEATLPALRDALVAAAAPPGSDPDTAATWVSDQLFADARAGGCQQTTRAGHAIETLQAMVLAARTEQFRASPVRSLRAPAFEEEWRWIGGFAPWRGVMFAFTTPEALLLPSLFEPKTPAFASLLAELGARPLSAQRGSALGAEYARYFEDVCTLQVGASCAAYARVIGQNGYAASDAGYRCFLFMFGRAPTRGRLYYSVADPENPDAFPQRPWAPVPSGEGYVADVIGAVPYQLPTGQRYVYAFFKRIVGAIEQLCYTRLDLETHVWGSPQTLPLPNGATQFSAILVARGDGYLGAMPKAWNFSSAPQLLVRVRDLSGNYSGNWHERQLAEQGDGWEADEFSTLEWGASNELHAAVDQGNNAFFLVIQAGPDLLFALYRMITWTTRQLVNGRRYTMGGGQWLLDHKFRGCLTFQFIPPTGYLSNQMLLVTLMPGGAVQALQVRRGAGDAVETTPLAHDFPAALRILPSAGSLQGEKLGTLNWFAFARDDQPGRSWFARLHRSAVGSTIALAMPATPAVTGPFDIAAPLSAASLQIRRTLIEGAYAANSTVTSLNLLMEAYYLVPVAIALECARSGERGAALEWFRLVYDFTRPVADRKIAHLLRREETLADLSVRAADWLLDPLAPHRIAATRRNCYTRFTIASIAQCMLDDADAEFAIDSPESLPRARRRYEAALALLDAPELAPSADACVELVGLLGSTATGGGPAVQVAIQQLRMEASAITDPRALSAAVEAANVALSGAGEERTPWATRVARAHDELARARTSVAPRIGEIVAAFDSTAARARDAAARSAQVDDALRRAGASATSELGRAISALTGATTTALDARRTTLSWLRSPVGNGTGNGTGLPPRADVRAMGVPKIEQLAAAGAAMPSDALGIMVPMSGGYVPPPPVSFCIPPNPTIDAMRAHARLNLRKLRTCRNIAGMERQMDAYAAATDASSGRPIAAGERITVPGAAAGPSLPPTQYGYAALIERAKQLVQLAAQMEAGLLHTIEAGQASALAKFRARQEVGIAVANVRLQNVRLSEANQGVTLAALQKARAQLQADTYRQWLQAGLNQWERALVDNYLEARDAHLDAARAEGAAQIMQAMATAAAGGATGAPAAMVFAGLASMAIMARTSASERAVREQASMQLNALYASVEQRRRDWDYQRQLAEQDIAIAAQQVTIASARVDVVTTEREIAELHATVARDTLAFLGNQFLDDARYEWMSRQYERSYRFFLREATVMARLAARELAFRRQEVLPLEIRDDYWAATDERAAPAGGDARGLTGSARLLEDIHRLDQYAFTTRRRALRITKTFSLARLFPLEFQRFRETGVLSFTTPMELFDRDFPGNYLRLIDRVRTSVIGLIPPTEGIRATLSASGISRVVIGPDVFQTVVLRRDPETIALSSPVGGIGLTELEPTPADLLRPFEGHGVDTTWEFRMPRASNACDFRALADVLLTLEFTAMASYEYREQVIRALSPTLHQERVFSLADDFADAWYDLLNPELLEAPQQMLVTFRTERRHFDPNLERLRIEQVMLRFARAGGMTDEIPVQRFHFRDDGGPAPVGGAATTVEGTISTRRGNGASWTPIIGRAPVGEWTLSLPPTVEVKRWFREGRITDVLLVVSYGGMTPPWPA